MGFGSSRTFDTGYSRPLHAPKNLNLDPLQRIADGIDKLVAEYVTEHIKLIAPGTLAVATSATQPTIIQQPIFSGTVPITRVVLQAITGTADFVFGESGDPSKLTEVRVSSNLPAPFVMPWCSEPCKVWVRNADTANILQYCVILLSAG